jgi:3-carboxy-cis,cis-muconate cycloisomerase
VTKSQASDTGDAPMADLARRYRDAPMAGRSNLQQAVPITFSYKAAVLLAAIERHRAKLAELRPRGRSGSLAAPSAHLLRSDRTDSRCGPP